MALKSACKLGMYIIAFLEKKPEQSEAIPVVTEPTSPPAALAKANSGEFVAHEVKLMTPNANPNPSPTPASSTGFQAAINQDDFPPAATPQVNSLNAPRQPVKNYGVVPSFLLVPKRRVLHNVRSNMKAMVPGKFVQRK